MRRIGFLLAALLVAASPLGAAEPGPTGFTARGTAQITFSRSATDTALFTADVAIAQRGSTYRLDLLRVSAGPAPFAALPLTGLFDRTKNTFTVFSPQSHKYMIFGPGLVHATATPAPSPSPSSSPKPNAFKDLKAMEMSVSFAGHGTTNGHPTTQLDYKFHLQYEGKPPFDLMATTQLAEDLDGLPVQIRVSGKPGPPGGPNVMLLVDVTSIERVAPTAGQFALPSGYAQTSNFFELMGQPPSPSPAPTA